MIAKIPKTNTRKMQTLTSPVIEEIIVTSNRRIALSLLIDLRGRSTLAVLSAFKKPGLIPGTKLSMLMSTIPKSRQFHASLK